MDQKKWRHDFQERRVRVKKGVEENLQLSSKEARLKSRVIYKAAKQEYHLAKKQYKLYRRPQPTARGKFLKEKLEEAKQSQKVAKKIYRKAQDRDGGSLPKKARRRAVQSGKFKLRQDAERLVRDNDILGDWASTRQTIRQAQYQKEGTKRTVKILGKAGKFAISQNYSTVNRTYNFVRGNGFTRTPKELSWEGKLSQKLRQARIKFRNSKAGKIASRTGKTARFVSKPIKSILHNPLSVKAYFLYFLIFGVLGLFIGVFGGASPVQQNEFDLNQSWLHLSKVDREKSNDKVEYWTNIDDILHYMNYRYGNEWNPSTSWKEGTGGKVAAFLGLNHFSDALTDIWKNLNQDPQNLKTMPELYNQKSSIKWMRLTKNELKEYQELQELIKEIGRYPNYQELDSPFYLATDEAHYKAPLVVLKRYGYVSKTKVYEDTQLKATTGQTLRAVLSGKVVVSGENITIETAEARFTYKQVGGIRVKNGDKVQTGVELGTVKTNGYQEIQYQKLEEKATKEKKAKWTAVNPGFYFANVTYNQTTSVLTDLNLSGDLAQRSRAVRDHIKKQIPNATDNGIAAMLGNFVTESGIKAKRAESDYLSPPIGATASSWDDENWLNMGFAQGASVGSLVIHRGLGLGMWTDTSDGAIRSTLLRNYAKAKGKKWYDLELQLDFMLEGDSPYYRTIAKEILTSNENVNTLTTRFLNQWEGNAGDKLAQRQNNAKQMLMYFKQTIKGSGTLASSWNFPEEYRSQIKQPPSTAAMTTQAGNGYPVGQCTWYAYNRLVELGKITDLSGSYGYLGNGQNWVMSLIGKGWKLSATPVEGAVVSTAGGFDGTLPQYGHVGIVEVVNADGSFLVSELNYAGNQSQIHWRVCRPAAYYSFAISR